MKTATKFPKQLVIATTLCLALVAGRPIAIGLPRPDEHNFAQAAVLDRVILSVLENYYDPERIDANRMFRAIMDVLQKAIAELKVRYDDEKQTAVVELLNHSHTLDLSTLRSPWQLSRTMRKLFKLIAQALPEQEYDFMDIEYAAANAMLSTLDPHSNALPPEIYDYLRMDTAGEFGGLGIKITTDRRPPCKGNLTVVEVFDDTPAKSAGLKVGDQIVRIAGESTVNITTSEAADRLRGTPGTKVKVQVKRGNGTILNFNIQREMIPIKSVEWEMLEGNVGYVILRAFQENSEAEMAEALKKLHAKGAASPDKKLKGLILDLRGNPGGLLHVAISIVDAFLPAGTIVTTAGRRADERTVENAHAENTEPIYPLVVLIDSSSASAAEIMAGALRNHGRALLIGDTTFGKGSVQMVQQIPGGGAIKLTSSQYLTPGDISIQAVGVAPDIRFMPVSVDPKEMNLVPNQARFSEADLDRHLDRPNIRTRTDGSMTTEAILYIPKSELESDKARYKKCFVDEEIDHPYTGRFEREFARRLVAGANGGSIDELFARARELVEANNREQEKLLESSLQKLRIDWSRPSGSGEASTGKQRSASPTSTKVVASVRTLGTVAPGKKLRIKATVQNRTKETIYRLRAVTESDNFYLTDRELVFGKLAPGQTRSWTDEISLPVTAQERIDEVQLNFQSDQGPIPPPAVIDVTVPERPSPRLTYGWHIQDLGNQDGFFQAGEELLMYVTVKNEGKGSTVNAEVGLSAKPGIDLVQGQFDIGNLAPGKTANGVLRLRVADPYLLETAELTMIIREWIETEGGFPSTRSLMEREIVLDIVGAKNKVGPADGTVTVNSDHSTITQSPAAGSHRVGTANKGAVFAVDGLLNDYFRIRLEKDRAAWISGNDVTAGGKLNPTYTLTLIEAPTIKVKGPLVRRQKKDRMILKGSASHPEGVRDLMVFVGDEKVLYLPAGQGKPQSQLDFSTEIPLEPGANNIVIIARHDDKVLGSQTVFVRLDAKPKK